MKSPGSTRVEITSRLVQHLLLKGILSFGSLDIVEKLLTVEGGFFFIFLSFHGESSWTEELVFVVPFQRLPRKIAARSIPQQSLV